MTHDHEQSLVPTKDAGIAPAPTKEVTVGHKTVVFDLWLSLVGGRLRIAISGPAKEKRPNVP